MDGWKGITVSGSGVARGRPDLARVRFTVTRSAPAVAQALADAAAAMDRVLSTLAAGGIRREDMQTAGFAVGPDYSRRGGTQVIRAYVVSNTIGVIVRELEQLGSILDRAVTAGAHDVWNVTFDLSSRRQLDEQAREVAMADARRKAEQLARLAGVSLGAVERIQESAGASPVYAAMSIMETADLAAPETPIEAGELEVSTQVEVTWAIA